METQEPMEAPEMPLQATRGAMDAFPRSSCGFPVLGPQSGKGGSSEEAWAGPAEGRWL